MSLTLKQTPLQKKKIVYSDFDINFDIHPLTGDIPRITNEESVKRSIRNIILTGLYERPYEPTVGSNLASVLFDQATDESSMSLGENIIIQTIQDNERRIDKISARLQLQPDNNQMTATIIFTLINNSTEFSFDLLLRRVR